jgi:hypothetical protein
MIGTMGIPISYKIFLLGLIFAAVLIDLSLAQTPGETDSLSFSLPNHGHVPIPTSIGSLNSSNVAKPYSTTFGSVNSSHENMAPPCGIGIGRGLADRILGEPPGE